MQVLPKYIEDLLDIFIGDIKQSIKECFAGIETKKLPNAKEKPVQMWNKANLNQAQVNH